MKINHKDLTDEQIASIDFGKVVNDTLLHQMVNRFMYTSYFCHYYKDTGLYVMCIDELCVLAMTELVKDEIYKEGLDLELTVFTDTDTGTLSTYKINL